MTVSSPITQRTNRSKPVAGNPTRQAQLRKLLSRKSGATIAQIQKAFALQPHTVQAAISAQRKAGCVIARSDADAGSVYRIVDEGCDT